MFEYRIEAILLSDLISQPLENRPVNVLYFTALAAHQVVVMRLTSWVIDEAPAAKVRFSHQT